MLLKIDDLQEIQADLDARIFELHATSRENTRDDRVLALLVELGEFANETRSFKYWSLNKEINEDEMFEEFSDVLHFALSLGIDIQFNQVAIKYEASHLSKTADIFRVMYQEIITFQKEGTLANYETMMVRMCQLAHKVGLSAEKMRAMYFYKNEINHARQDNEY